MANCSVSGCKKLAKFDGFCTVHRPKSATKATIVYTLDYGREKGKLAANTSFVAMAESDTPTAPYKRRIEHLLGQGPQSGGEELVHGISCLHDTQPSNNVTVWFSWKGTAMTVWGLGQHSGGSGAGNSKYSMLWYDGTNKKWTRGK